MNTGTEEMGDNPFSSVHPELHDEFEKLWSSRSYLQSRWELYAGWTLPYMFPTDTYESTAEMQNDFQSVGAQAVNHLANKIVDVLLPKGRTFFRLDLTEEQQVELVNLGIPEDEHDELLIALEKAALRKTEKISLRVALIHCVKQLIITGNGLLYFPTDGEIVQSINLKCYVQKRDASGRLLKLVMKDQHEVASLPEELRLQARLKGLGEEDEVDIYTGVVRAGKRFYVKQELGDFYVVADRMGVYNKDTLPWIPVSWNLPRGYDYGVGLVEEYAGDFDQLSLLTESIRNLAGIASDIKFLVNPMGRTKVEDLNEGDPGDYVPGHEDDVSVLQVDKVNDMNFMSTQIDTVARRIGTAFLLNTAVTRQAERVTAEEIRMQAAELESALGGIYSRFGVEIQQPLADKLLRALDNGLKGVEPTILTGVESLSRTSELEQIQLFFNDLGLLNNVPEAVLQRMKLDNVIADIGSRRQVDYKDYIKDDEEVAKDMQRQNASEAQNAFGQEAGKVQAQQLAPQG